MMTANSNAHTLADFSGTLLLVGAGKMGGAMLEGWLALGLDAEKRRRDRAAARERDHGAGAARRAAQSVRGDRRGDGARHRGQAAGRARRAADAPALCRTFDRRGLDHGGPAAAFLEQTLPGAAIVRAMPNTPAAIGRGITVAVPNARVSAPQRELVDTLLSATGAVEWIADEALMDAVTALSGSGPAYVFLLAEAMARAGAAAGLPPALADTLARATVAGSGELLRRSTLDAATLRQNVTSPGGTTAAALEVLMAKDGLESLMTKAIAAATRRSRELAG